MWIFLLSMCVFTSLVVSLIFCVCWKHKTPKNEWLGVDGMVTQKNPDENVNHLPSAASTKNGVTLAENLDKRGGLTNSRRSLPDIPSEMVAGISWEANGDNSSEHYATLGQYANAGEKLSGVKSSEVRTSVSQHSSMSQADDAFSPYERVKYDKIKSKKEHPYAQVQPPSSRTVVYEEGPISEERITLLRADIPSTSANTASPIRSRRTSDENAESVDIPAASAVAGGIAASYELPYMTPPINFSGDSQDSSKGYTSISVREPLANIIAQTQASNKQKRKLDVLYSTVSDDSDDVYTTIPDPNNPIYTSESETYARIPPLPITVEAEINIPPDERQIVRDRDEVDQLYEAPHQPIPSNLDSLKHVASHSYTHSRQASSSSSSANVGSPKPEKRQANSPLPPPPTASNLDFHTDKLQVKRNLDDLYAKVQKNRKDDGIEESSSDRSSITDSLRGTYGISASTPETGTEHNYETLKKSSTTNSDFGYEKIKGGDVCEPGYASINGPGSLANSSDPGYEALRDVTFEIPPNYEELRHQISDPIAAGYSVVNKKKKVCFIRISSLIIKPQVSFLKNPSENYNYQEILGPPLEPNYAAPKSSGSESDPNYESVNQSDPNYESVKDLEPFYEINAARTKTQDLEAYEKVKCDVSESSNSASRTTESEPPYERLRNEADSSEVAGYDKVGSHGSGSSGNEVESIPNEESDVALNLHDENAVVQV
ncbi:uncharacterized protein [Euwallacea similis]|uniref:uncharacterized protein isoform X1 n=1 Tax=Euwallacea similis TaxID=1736056 RepID=UPI00344B2BCC